MDKIAVVIIDDHTLFREGLESLLKSRGIEVAASLGDGEKGIELVRQLQPQAVLLDVRMPGIDGIKVLRRLIEHGIAAPIIILTTSRNEKDLADAMKNGARGYFLKDMEPDGLVAALREVIAGNKVVAPAMREAYAHIASRPFDDADPVENLTPREREILHLLAEGQSNKMIANTLGISDGTVKLHVKSILRKLDVRSRVEAAIIAAELERQTADRGGL